VTGTRDGAETRAEVDWSSSGMLFVVTHMRSFVKNTHIRGCSFTSFFFFFFLFIHYPRVRPI